MAFSPCENNGVFWNTGAERVFGYTEAEVIGRPHSLLFAAEDTENGEPGKEMEADTFEGERLRVRKDGSTFVASVSIWAVRREGGPLVGYAEVTRDFSERKRAEQALARYHERLGLLHRIDKALIAGDQPAEIAAAALPLVRDLLGVDRAIVNLFDLDRGEVEWLAAAGRRRVRIGPGVRFSMQFMGDVEALRKDIPQFIDTHSLPPGPEVDALLASGVHSYAVVPLIAGGELIGAISFGGGTGHVSAEQIGIAREVATQFAIALTHARLHERVKRQAEDLEAQVRDTRRMEEERNRFFDLSVDMLCVVGFDGYFKLLNRSWEATLGWSTEELTSRPHLDFVHPDDRALTSSEAAKVIRGNVTLSFDNRYRCKDGSYRWLSWRASPDPARQVLYAMARDVTDLKQAEQKFRNVLEAAPESMVIVDPHGRIVLVNNQTESVFGYPREELLGKPVEVLLAERYRANHAAERDARFVTGPRVRRMGAGLDLHGLRKDGSEFPIEMSLSPLETEEGVLIVSAIRDLTESKMLEEQLRQSQKMEAIGKLAGGVAHDFNNLLTVINGYSDLMMANRPADDPDRDMLREIVSASGRAAGLTRQLLAFSRKEVIAPKVLDLAEVIGETEKWLRRLIGEDVALIVASGPPPWPVKIDVGQVEQVILNLVVNARDAMPKGGTVTIRARNVEGQEAARGSPPGRYVLVTVTDTGVGMDAAMKARIFEPFFTTKGDRGTGLGLATVYGIVKRANGHIEVESEPGRGTEFKLYFPATLERKPTGKSFQGVLPMPRGGETVLLVEDEGPVRALGRLILESCGYKVLEAANGPEALQIGSLFREPIHLLLTDVVLPGMGGREVADGLLTLHPEARVLYVSGYTDDAIIRHGVRHSEVAFLQKPYNTSSLARKVRDVLDG